MTATEDRLVDALGAWAGGVPDDVPPPYGSWTWAHDGARDGADMGAHDGVLDLDPSGGLHDTVGVGEVHRLRRHHLRVVVALAAAVALLVAGAGLATRSLRSAQVTPATRLSHLMAVFDRPATARDRLPATVLDGAGADFVRSRYLGSWGPSTYWAALQGDGQVCLLNRTTDSGTSTTCATLARFARSGTPPVGQQVTGSTEDVTARLVPDQGPASHRSRGGDRHVLRNVYASVTRS